MFPPLFMRAAEDPAVTALFGTNPLRIWPFGQAERKPARPYAVWQTISGTPEDYLGEPPDLDDYTLQIEVYAKDEDQLLEATRALRDMVERHARIGAWRGDGVDPETGDFFIRFDVDWVALR